MNIDRLLSCHEIALTQADTAASREAELAHLGRARCYAERVRALRVAPDGVPVVAGQI